MEDQTKPLLTKETACPQSRNHKPRFLRSVKIRCPKLLDLWAERYPARRPVAQNPGCRRRRRRTRRIFRPPPETLGCRQTKAISCMPRRAVLYDRTCSPCALRLMASLDDPGYGSCDRSESVDRPSTNPWPHRFHGIVCLGGNHCCRRQCAPTGHGVWVGKGWSMFRLVFYFELTVPVVHDPTSRACSKCSNVPRLLEPTSCPPNAI